MILKVHIPGAPSYDIGDEIWHESLAEAIRSEAETIAAYAGSDLLESPGKGVRDGLRDQLIHEMTASLVQVGDTYRGPDGVLYSLVEEPEHYESVDDGRLSPVTIEPAAPIVEEVLRFEDLPLESGGTRRAVVRWSDGTDGEALKWYGDELLVCEGDHGNCPLMVPAGGEVPQPASLGLEVGYII